MAIKLQCSGCSKELQFEDGRESGYCNYCGQKIDFSEVKVEKNVPSSSGVLQELIQVSNSAFSDGKNGDLDSLGDRILQLDGNNWHGYVCKAYAQLVAFDFEKAYDNFSKAFELMNESEFMEKRSEFVTRIANSICSITLETEEKSGNAIPMIFEANMKDNNEECCFAISILEEIQKNNKSFTPENIAWIYTEYCEILFACIVTAFEPRLMLYASLSSQFFFSDKKFTEMFSVYSFGNNDAVIEATNFFYEYLSKRLNETLEKMSDEEIEKIVNYWIKSENPSFIQHLYNARALSAERFSKGMFAKRKLKKEIFGEVDQFIASYFGCKEEEWPTEE